MVAGIDCENGRDAGGEVQESERQIAILEIIAKSKCGYLFKLFWPDSYQTKVGA
jgi:hypothetical protein